MAQLPTLGQLEETVLLIVLILDGEGYGVSISEAYRQHTEREISIPAIHTVLKRLERKGFVRSRLGEATPTRGGRPKRYFTATAYGIKVVQALRTMRESLWSSIPLNLLNL